MAQQKRAAALHARRRAVPVAQPQSAPKKVPQRLQNVFPAKRQ